MHVKSRLMAFGGLALALCILFMALGSIFETGTLFFLAASSFFVGIVIRESGMKMGLAFYLAAVLLGFILAPNKFYVITFGAMGLYILAVEGPGGFSPKAPAGRGKEVCSGDQVSGVQRHVHPGSLFAPGAPFFQGAVAGGSCGRPGGRAGRSVDL